LLSILTISKVYIEIPVSFGLVQNLEIWKLKKSISQLPMTYKTFSLQPWKPGVSQLIYYFNFPTRLFAIKFFLRIHVRFQFYSVCKALPSYKLLLFQLKCRYFADFACLWKFCWWNTRKTRINLKHRLSFFAGFSSWANRPDLSL
jgi:hypothetical protein